MGKKARKTRWRTLTLADEFSDSEASSTTTAPGLREVFKSQKFPSNRYTYSSQSTPRRKYQYDGTKSTRSSSTASENKMAFNEDDYTKISTPRQDVLFKKGYLNKPKTYNTQTSTGASTNSTGNSTGNGTPDYQSTDLEYESQFVFPNGFVDHNGYCYVNGYEYPFMFYNVPTYYPEYTNHRSKRYSSGSLTESASPNNEEATSQDLSSAEASNSHSDYSGHYPVHNHFNGHTPNCPNYYQNGTSSPTGAANGECHVVDQTRKLKKRRRRITNSQLDEQDSTENSDADTNIEEQRITTASHPIDSNENVLEKVESQEQNGKLLGVTCEEIEARLLQNQNEKTNEKDQPSNIQNSNERTSAVLNDSESLQNPTIIKLECTTLSDAAIPSDTLNHKENPDESNNIIESSQESNPSEIPQLDTLNHTQISDSAEPTNNQEVPKLSESSDQEETSNCQLSNNTETTTNDKPNNNNNNSNNNVETTEMVSQDHEQQSSNVPKYDLKPDAEEFVPRAYRTHDVPISPVQFINISGNFMPIPVFPFNGQNFNPAFIPPGIPVNFIPPDPKMFPNYMAGFPPGGPMYNGHGDVYNEEHQQHNSEKTDLPDGNCDNSNTANDHQEPEPVDKSKSSNSKTIDIATVVSKLEVAAKEQEEKESNATNKTIPQDNNNDNSPKKYIRTHPRFKNNLTPYNNGNYKNRSQNSPQREIRYRNNRDFRHRNAANVPNGETNISNGQTIDTPQNIQINHTISPSYKSMINPAPADQSNSPVRQNIENALTNSSKPYSYNSQLPQTVPNGQSPLRRNETYRKSPYRSNMPKSSSTAFTPLVSNETTEVRTPTSIPPLPDVNSSRRSPEKVKKVWKQTNQQNNNKWKQFHATTMPDNRTKSLDTKELKQNGIRNEINIKNNSENSKTNPKAKNTTLQQQNGDISSKDQNRISSSKAEPTKVSNLPQENSNINSPKSPNQWISVQKRKKRKNKNVEEVDNFTDEENDDQLQNDQFESYDVNQLVDVVLPPEIQNVNSDVTTTDEQIKENTAANANQNVVEEGEEEVLTVIIETPPSTVETDTIPSGESNETSDITNDVELQQVDTEVSSSVGDIQTESEKLEEVTSSTIEIKEEPENIVTTKDKKKKFKKNTQKPLKKKVIITDLDLSEQYTEIKEPVKKIITKVEKTPPPLPSTSQETKDELEEPKIENISDVTVTGTFEKEASTESINSSEQDEKKKSKKKKKKTSKLNTSSTSVNSDSILGTVEDTFDFLNSALTGETEEKTNDEISEELDKIIQKGMLNSIEVKIKSLNIDESDGFFKSVWTKLSRKETNMGYTKIPDFTEILKPSSAKPQLVSEEIDLKNKECSDSVVESTIEDGLFLEYPDLVEVLEDDDKAAAIPPETVDSVIEEVKRAKHEIEIGKIDQPDTLYPITNAVKEWMCRTRETTPDVELLKSPSRLYREFGDTSDSGDSEIEVCDSVENFSKELTPSSEITVFAPDREQSIEQQDLMEYWEDDVNEISENIEETNKERKPKEVEANDEDEDEIPVYESQYGKNEDFLNIQRQVREQNETCGIAPSQAHTSLPQRAAVCCNIM